MSAKKEEIIKKLPQKIGVYKFLDSTNKIIYVGKAKNLRKRVGSYFSTKTSGKTLRLVNKIDDVKYILVQNELDALLLENNLIKKYQPKYNVLMKDDKSYPWIKITKENFPKILFTRKVVNDGSDYFGPYKSTYVINVLIDLFYDMFYDSGWTPITLLKNKVNSQKNEKYQEIIKKIKSILKGNLKILINQLTIKMEKQSELLNFEEAKKIKSKIDLLKDYRSKSIIVSSKISNVDVFSLVSNSLNAVVNYLSIINGSIVLSHIMEFKKRLSEKDEEIMRLAIIRSREVFNSKSKTIYSNIKISEIYENVNIFYPKIGDKKKLLILSERNAKYNLLEIERKKLKENERSKTKPSLIFLKKDLKLKTIPIHIECFDNSNIQGSLPTSSCVVFKNGLPSKKDYRIFKIKTITKADDFASMREVVFRRYKRVLDEKGDLPNLIVIDGGKGQLSSAEESLKRLGLSGKIAIIGIAKKLESIYFPNDKIPLFIDKKSPSLKLIQTIRNEAHRFAINYHKKRRLKSTLSSALTDIDGIGEKTAELLIKKIGSVRRIYETDLDILSSIIGEKKASLVLTGLTSVFKNASGEI